MAEEHIFSAPGKVILHGEHAVVYGKSALAAALNLRTFVRFLLVQSEGDTHQREIDGDATTTHPPITGRERLFQVHLTDLGVKRVWNVEDLESLLPAYKEDRLQAFSSRNSSSSKKKSRESSSSSSASNESSLNSPNDPSAKTLALLKKLVAKQDSVVVDLSNGDAGHETSSSSSPPPSSSSSSPPPPPPPPPAATASAVVVETALLPLLHLFLGICGTQARYGGGKGGGSGSGSGSGGSGGSGSGGSGSGSGGSGSGGGSGGSGGSGSGGGRLPSAVVVVASNVPVGAGLGSSAALCTSLAAAFLKSCGVGDKKVVNQWAFSGEKLIHGTPSGIDNAVATYGNVLLYKDGRITTHEAAVNLDVLLVNTNVPRNTKDLVSLVRARHTQTPSIFTPIFESIDRIVHHSEQLLRELRKAEEIQTRANLYDQLGELFHVNHCLLNALGVGHEALERVCDIARKKGRLHAKLTGAGGGGCAICLIDEGATDEEVEEVVAALSSEVGASCVRTTVGGEGLVNHSDVIDEEVAFLKSIMKSAYDIPSRLFPKVTTTTTTTTTMMTTTPMTSSMNNGH